MNLKWKYVGPISNKSINEIENYFNIKYPDDYLELLKKCNQGKPNKYCFDIDSRKGCVLDYLINLKEVISISMRIKRNDIIPIANDPFGNIIGYKLDKNNKVESLVFWDHETNKTTFISRTFELFLLMLY